MNLHRDRIYQERTKILEGADMKSNILEMVEEEIGALVTAGVPKDPGNEEWDPEAVLTEYSNMVPLEGRITVEELEELSHEEIHDLLIDFARREYEEKERQQGADQLRILERLVLLQTIDRLWVDHLTAIDEMRAGIGLRAWGQIDPLVAYKREAHDMWGQLLEGIREQISRTIYKVTLAPAIMTPPRRVSPGTIRTNQDEVEAAGIETGTAAAVPPPATNGAAQPRQPVAVGVKIGRNEPCHCGSGRKYKKCHGAVV